MREKIQNFQHLESLVDVGESIILEFKSENVVEDKGNENPILRGTVALANTRGGNLVIGVEKRGEKHEIVGTSYNQDFIQNHISQLIDSYVDPPNLPFTAYSIKSEEEKVICIAIHVDRGPTKYALRHFGRKSQKYGYHMLMRIGDSSREVDFGTFWSVAFTSLIETLSSIPKQITSPIQTSDISVVHNKKFELNGAEWYLQELNKKLHPAIEERLLNEFRSKLANLEYDHVNAWTEDIKKFVSSLLDYIDKKLGDEERRNRVLDFLKIMINRCDKETKEKIYNRFLITFEDLYEQMLENHQLTQAQDLLSLLQYLKNYDLNFMNKLVMNAINKWDDNEFSQRAGGLQFYYVQDKDGLKQLKSKLVNLMSKYREQGNDIKFSRSARIYDLIRNI